MGGDGAFSFFPFSSLLTGLKLFPFLALFLVVLIRISFLSHKVENKKNQNDIMYLGRCGSQLSSEVPWIPGDEDP